MHGLEDGAEVPLPNLRACDNVLEKYSEDIQQDRKEQQGEEDRSLAMQLRSTED